MAEYVNGSQTLAEGVQALIDGAIADYTRRQTASIGYMYSVLAEGSAESKEQRRKEQTEESIAQYANSMRSTKGQRYIKVIQDNSVHCFIVATSEDKQFKLGDVLKAESWSRPARNRARGNVLTGFYTEWTGAPYLN